MKKIFLFLCFFVFATSLCVSQNSSWGGIGKVYINYQGARGSPVKIQFVVSQSYGTGTADFRCEVTSPRGVIHQAKKASSAWSGGQAYAEFTYPYDFSGNDEIKPGTQTPGTYFVQCFWYIQGYGVNGKIAASNNIFVVQ
jgi:hypothetical protein